MVRRIYAFLTLLAVPLLGDTIRDMPDATAVGATDGFFCDQGDPAVTRECLASQLATYISGAIFTSDTYMQYITYDPLKDGVVDEAETLVDGSYGAFDWASSVATINDDVVTPDMVLLAGQSDGLCLTYKAAGDTWEWASCGSGSGDMLKSTYDTDTDNLVDTAETTIQFRSGTSFPGSPTTGDLFRITDDSVAGACDSAAGSDVTLCIYDGAGWEAFVTGYGADGTYGDITISGGAFSLETDSVDSAEIAADAVGEVELDINNSPTDEYVLAYEVSDGRMKWVSNAAGTETDPTLTDDTAVTIGDGTGADQVLTFDSATGDGTLTWDDSAQEFDFNAPITTPATADPSV